MNYDELDSQSEHRGGNKRAEKKGKKHGRMETTNEEGLDGNSDGVHRGSLNEAHTARKRA